MLSVLNSWGLGGARDIVYYQKNFKRPSLTGKVLPDRDKAFMYQPRKSILIVQAL